MASVEEHNLPGRQAIKQIIISFLGVVSKLLNFHTERGPPLDGAGRTQLYTPSP